MSGGEVGNRYNTPMNPGLDSQQEKYFDKPRHGCEIEIARRQGDSISHLNGIHVIYPTVRSYSDGVKIGCTFITNEALELIYKWHKDFTESENSKIHQL